MTSPERGIHTRREKTQKSGNEAEKSLKTKEVSLKTNLNVHDLGTESAHQLSAFLENGWHERSAPDG